MKRIVGLMLVLAAGLAVGACDKKESGGASGSSSAASGGGSGDSIGVKECDDYFAKLNSCMGKMDPATKGVMESTQKQNKEAWKAAAATPAGKTSLATTCKAALDGLAANPACK